MPWARLGLGGCAQGGPRWPIVHAILLAGGVSRSSTGTGIKLKAKAPPGKPLRKKNTLPSQKWLSEVRARLLHTFGTIRASFATSQHPNTIISYRRTPPLLHCSLPQFLSPPQDDPDQAEHVLGNSTSGQKEDRLGAAPDHAQRAANRQRAAITVQTHYRLNMKRQLVMSRMVPLLRRDTCSTSEWLRGRQSFVDTSTKSRGRLLDTPPALRPPERPRRASCEF